MNTNELYHHGIKGMKWGVRRYQNPDGSYTAAGKKRRSSGAPSESNRNDERAMKVKKAAMVGAAVVAAGLATYGAVKISKNVKLNKSIEEVVKEQTNKYARTKAKELSNVFVETLHEEPGPELFKSFYNKNKPSQEVLLKEKKNLRKQYRQALKDFRSAQKDYRKGKTRLIPNFDLDYNPLRRYEFRP